MGYISTTSGGEYYVPDQCFHCSLSTWGAHQVNCPLYGQLVTDWYINPHYGQDEYIYYSPGILVPEVEAR